jgi:hypothetical protein
MSEDTPVSAAERIAASFKRLAETASVLNKASDEFGKPIAQIEQALCRLNIGVEAWERIRGGTDDSTGEYWRESVGFTKVDGEWCLAINENSGNQHYGDVHYDRTWTFASAPRSLRIAAIDQLPDLVEKLISVADKTAKKMREKSNDAIALAQAVTSAAAEIAPKKGGRP